jgi:hypothetical protein
MSTAAKRKSPKSAKSAPKTVHLIASGDLRLSANQKCWPEQARMEGILADAVKAEGGLLVRAHTFDKAKGHGFIDSQKMGMEVFRNIDPEAPLIVAESVWQYSHHVLAGLSTHRGPILTVANWSGTVAGPGRHAEPERVAHQGGGALQHVVERDLPPMPSSGTACANGSPRSGQP